MGAQREAKFPGGSQCLEIALAGAYRGRGDTPLRSGLDAEGVHRRLRELSLLQGELRAPRCSGPCRELKCGPDPLRFLREVWGAVGRKGAVGVPLGAIKCGP